MLNIRVLVPGLVLILGGCEATTPYQRLSGATFSGGYSDQDLGRDVFRVEFSANGFTTRETAQSFWLWRCAELTLERNFDGFEVLSDMRLAQDRPLSIPQADLDGPYQRVVYIPIFIPAPDESAKPRFLGDIHLFERPCRI